MKFSRESRIITLLVIDTLFFFVEIITGYMVHSLALVADSFHMLNDVFSLVIALWAIKVSNKPSNAKNSYGWQRAEILGALINGTFLLALCLSIFMEAIQRFFNIDEISNPKLVIIVGSLGLASNIVGLFLFHEHGHGGHSHSHDEEAPKSVSHHHLTQEASEVSEPAIPSDAHTRSKSRQRADSFGSLYGHPAQTRAMVMETAQEFGYGRHKSVSGEAAFSPSSSYGGESAMSPPTGSNSRSRSAGGHKHGRETSRNLDSVIEASREHSIDSSKARKAADHSHDEHSHEGNGHAHEANGNGKAGHDHDDHDHDHAGHDHSGHSHGKKSGGGHGHSHGSMNMKGVFLHVLGDALGNVGVIAAGLVILLAEGRWKYYFDPAISLIITCIIFSSALPLVKSASYILLQGVPGHIDLEDVRYSINEVDGVLSLHELHIWQLSETTVVASVHVLVARGKDYMQVASGIRKALHEHGVHSSTIQPEFGEQADNDVGTSCLIRCPPETCAPEACCPPVGNLVDVDGNPSASDGSAAPAQTQTQPNYSSANAV